MATKRRSRVCLKHSRIFAASPVNEDGRLLPATVYPSLKDIWYKIRMRPTDFRTANRLVGWVPISVLPLMAVIWCPNRAHHVCASAFHLARGVLGKAVESRFPSAFARIGFPPAVSEIRSGNGWILRLRGFRPHS